MSICDEVFLLLFSTVKCGRSSLCLIALVSLDSPLLDSPLTWTYGFTVTNEVLCEGSFKLMIM